jgi:hypothetical protein
MLKQPVADFAKAIQWLCLADVPQVGRAVGFGLGFGGSYSGRSKTFLFPLHPKCLLLKLERLADSGDEF